MLRPGFARISLPFFMADDEVAFVMEALKMVATEGWKLLPQYILNPETGEWRHRSNLVSYNIYVLYSLLCMVSMLLLLFFQLISNINKQFYNESDIAYAFIKLIFLLLKVWK
jgi:hypothetical protein